ncbi:MAG: AAA family ATPase [Candidatus Competibacteraceae bacterium]|nr:AAA family ATPase [Candidatus Competibacteraceae bacterium]
MRNPLATAGLFAICGPTGAGKSTLLDALCLALYDETPRLTRATVKGISLPDVGEETITPQDPRNLLRRGAGEGSAEVDFIGNDGLAYRARWSVRRARGKAGGKLQNTEMLLQTLDGEQRIGGVKIEVQQAIRERLGLSFPQFTRAVLLAQNEFAVFLKANDNERAELLETLTGLDAYTGISIRAFERAKAEQQALDALKSQLAGQQPLAGEARAELDRQLAAAKEETATLDQRKTELDRQLQWHEAWDKLKHSEQQALETVQQARADQEIAAPRQQQLARVEAVQDARPVVEAADRAAAEVDRCRQAVQSAEHQRDEARRLLQRAEEARANAAQAVAAAEQRRADAGDALNQARSLDTEIHTLAPSHESAVAILNEARRAEIEAQKRLTEKQTERQKVAQDLQTVQEWLTQHQPLRVLAEDWPRWDVLLADAATLQDDLRGAEQKIAAGQRDSQKQRRELDQATEQCAKAETALHAAESRLQAALAELAGFDTETLAARRQTAQTRADQLTEAERLWNNLSVAQTQQRKLEEESRTLQEQVAQDEAALNQLAAEKPAATVRLEQAEKSLKTAEAASAKSVETLRANLEPDSPCPVCGATDHPYTAGDAPTRAMLAALKADVGECRKALESLVAGESAQQTRRDHHRQRLMELAKEQKTLTTALERDRAAWNAHPLTPELTAIASADRSGWLTDQQQQIRNDLATIGQQENAQRQAAQQRDAAQKTRDQAQKQHSAAQTTLNTAQATFERTTQSLQTARERQTDLARQLAERLDALDAAFSGHDWRPLWQTDPARFHEQRREKVAQWNARSQQVETWQKQIDVLEVAINGDIDQAAEKAAHLERAAADFKRIDDALRDKRRQRQTLFDGRAVTDVEAQLAQAIEDARRALQQQEDVARQAGQTQASAETTLKSEQKALGERQQAAERATATLGQWLADCNARQPDALLDIPALRALLVHDSAWLKREQEALKALADAVSRAETILKERRKQQEDHERQRANLDSVETVRDAQQKILADLTAARSRATEAELNVRQDDERRTKTASLQAYILQQEAKTRLWGQLNELIGSADGKKFRNHAQQFTLDVLLGYANHHLNDLSRRYRLERVKDTLALMVVDQDMGDEIRSVHSLSGGESFLVSLALALGLASLSSNRVRVESLFIDEGFGSLDADTLRVAMDALDNLQAQGRKVGVISHVQDMTERIGVQIQVRRQSGGQSRVEVTPAVR